MLLVRLILIALCAMNALGADFSQLQPQGHVSDFAQVLNPAHRAEIERYCRRVQELTSAEIAIVTIPTLDGDTVEDVANSLFRRWGVGKKGKDEGLLLLLVAGDRRLRLEVGYGLEPILPDGLAGELLDHMRPLLRQREYGPALLEAAHQMGASIAKAKNVNLDVSIPSRREAKRSQAHLLPILFPIGFVLLLLWLSRRSRGGSGHSGFGGPWISPGGFGGSSGGSSGGGFGGYDSGDSFGGFGGGDSGGGGASSDW